MLHVVISANAKNLSSLFLHLISIIIYKSLSLSLSLYLATSGNLGFRTRQLLKNSILSLRRKRIFRPEVIKVPRHRVQRGIRETIRRSAGIIPRSSVPRDPLVRQRSRLFDGLFSPVGAHRKVQNFANLVDDFLGVLFVLRVRLFADTEQRERLVVVRLDLKKRFVSTFLLRFLTFRVRERGEKSERSNPQTRFRVGFPSPPFDDRDERQRST
jgi:hypothetical protein